MSNGDVEKITNNILRQPCPYTVPPFHFIGGHQFCPCFCKALRAAYIGGFEDAKEGREPEVGVFAKREEDNAS